jgi:hypothetical protein
LFGHLVSRFSTHPENLATEALAFIVSRSATMREELRNLFGRTGKELPPLARFRSQAGDEQGNIPDLIGLDTTGAERLFIENKFWAGLTENQPAGYLERLPAKGGGLLVFIVPSRRFAIVWNELAGSAMNREGAPAIEDSTGKYWFRYGKRHRDDGPAIERAFLRLFGARPSVHPSFSPHQAQWCPRSLRGCCRDRDGDCITSSYEQLRTNTHPGRRHLLHSIRGSIPPVSAVKCYPLHRQPLLLCRTHRLWHWFQP